MDAQPYQAAAARQFPQLDLSGFRVLGEGGVFRVFETSNGLVWRFLKHPAGEAGLDLEIRLLAELAGALSLPIPRYEYVSDRTISPRFVGYRKIEGVPFTRERLAACCSDRPLRQLARFLTDLHCLPLERVRAIGIPLSTPDERGAQWAQWSGQVHQHVYPLLNERQRAWAEHTLSDLLSDDAMFDFSPAFCHGDLWAEHILFDPKQEMLTGVLDFESACLGDPAGDWVAVWLDHGDAVVRALLAHYGGPVNSTLHHRITRLASYVPLNEILCGVLYDDRASWQSGWMRLPA